MYKRLDCSMSFIASLKKHKKKDNVKTFQKQS